MRTSSLVLCAALVLAACGGSKQGAPSAGGTGGATTSSGAPEAGGSAGEATGGATGGAATGDTKASTPAAAPDKIDGALPETKDAKPFPRRYECGAKGCNLPLLVPDALKAQLEKDAPVFMFEVVMPPKVSMLLPRHAGLDVYGLLIDGELSVLADDIKEKQKRAWKLNGFRAPGAGVNIYSKEPTRLILAVVVNGTSGSVAEQIDRLEKKDKTASWTKRSAPVTSFELSAKPDLAWGGGAYHARIALEEPPASFGLLTMSKNAPVVEHVHDKEWEFLAIIDGSGELVRKTSGKVPVNGSTFAANKPGEPHAFKPAGDRPTIAIQMYWPPGPEQRFKKLAEGGK
ncbi:MAG: cupin domain-containing protein [Deltaproteobacteria bacterium]|nr:cupin domain-containing protein [Deltaproteobacteria bacterium]